MELGFLGVESFLRRVFDKDGKGISVFLSLVY